MSKKNHPPAPVPPGNRPQAGPAFEAKDDATEVPTAEQATKFQEHTAEERLGDYTGTGEHARVQPGPKNDGGGRGK